MYFIDVTYGCPTATRHGSTTGIYCLIGTRRSEVIFGYDELSSHTVVASYYRHHIFLYIVTFALTVFNLYFLLFVTNK